MADENSGHYSNSLIREPLAFASATGQGLCHADLYQPAGKPRFGLLIAHGMAEHHRRYDEFACWFVEHDAVVLSFDHAGHGESARDHDHLGFFAEKDGDILVLQDLDQLVKYFRNRFPELPLILLGHSMGSLIVRDYLTSNGHLLNGVILTGTSGPNPQLTIGRWLARSIQRIYGPRHRSKLLDGMLHQGFLSRIEQPETEFDWLTRDRQIVAEYLADPDCGYLFTVSGLLDIIAWTERISRPEWASLLPKELPILLASGEHDPVGQFGRGVERVAKWLETAGCTVKTILYPLARHEILNETDRLAVYADLDAWISETVLK